jgi:hypothetical protein
MKSVTDFNILLKNNPEVLCIGGHVSKMSAGTTMKLLKLKPHKTTQSAIVGLS